ncbi:TRAP-type C4-dicarboxylate transport system, small permease component [Gracilibacillus ureilyticus]|uniref:TRAP-type C4-dicarboxylate transport system, small permease component n=1 Tax=Gracilibacillus ureilyticus TaxID=531814 RepID=A0A1H9PU22_9BACI|nr:TRAP transporter small permease [Gracilibacillus ureilyticus]SER51628.1 TRAP-type C4-dicarboxylate transport system, small permease component [Gracilibacillus ureilyticus]
MEFAKKQLDNALSTICIGLFGFLVILVTWQVITRFVLNNPSVFSEELAKYCFVWIVLIGSAIVFGEKGHMAVEMVKEQFPKKIRIITEVIIEMINAVFALFVLLIGGIAAVEIAWNQANATLQIPVGYLYAVMPISGLCIMFYCVYNIYQLISNRALTNT